jgi:hypothetical protein
LQRPRVDQFRQLVGKLFAYRRYERKAFLFRCQPFQVAAFIV